MKVAFATEDLARVDAHFGWARNIAIYEVTPEGHRLVEVVQFDGDLKEDGTEDKLNPKLDAIRDCAIVYVAAIGGSAAARVVHSKVHPVKVPEPKSIEDILARLREVTMLKAPEVKVYASADIEIGPIDLTTVWPAQRYVLRSEFEKVRDHGLRAVFGNWSFQKNHSREKEKYANLRLAWVAYVGGKRESREYRTGNGQDYKHSALGM